MSGRKQVCAFPQSFRGRAGRRWPLHAYSPSAFPPRPAPPAATYRACAGLYGLSVGPAASGIGGSLYFDKAGVVSASLRMASSLDLGAALRQLGMGLPVDVSDVLVIVNPQVSVVSSRAASLGVSNGKWERGRTQQAKRCCCCCCGVAAQRQRLGGHRSARARGDCRIHVSTVPESRSPGLGTSC